MAAEDVPSLSRFLRMAVVTGVEKAVRIHIDRGDDLNARDENGQTPLMLSAARDKAEICRLLLAAGADVGLLDPAGRDALEIARAAGALNAASVIETARNPLPTDGDDVVDIAETPEGMKGVSGAGNGYDADPSGEAIPVQGGDAHEVALIVFDDGSGFDLGRWEVDEDQEPPEGNTTLAMAAVEVQTAIIAHQPLDTSADWDDFEAVLPDRSAPPICDGESEGRERLRMVLLRAIREGSVPYASIEDLSSGNDGEPDVQASALLVMVVNDLGAETDERLDYPAPHVSFEDSVDPEEEPVEEDLVVEALAFVDDLAAHRKGSLRLYERDFQREAPLTAAAEVALGQAMERGLEKALDALASWPSGIAATLEAARQVAERARPMRSVSFGPQKHTQGAQTAPTAGLDADSEAGVETEPPANRSESGVSEDEAPSQSGLEAIASADDLVEFRTNAEILSSLAVGVSQNGDGWPECRGALASMRLAPSFLMELADSGLVDELGFARAFGQAMRTYRHARERMIVANLKLVYSIARRYLFSGQPIDDLLQEGYIGLILSVDRYEWRRGFRLSTYATWWIRQRIGRFVADMGRTIRLPLNVYEKAQRVVRAARDFELRNGYAATMDGIAPLVDMPIEKVKALSKMCDKPIPLDEIAECDGRIYVEALESFVVCDPVESLEGLELVESLDNLLSALQPKEASILRMRYGIGRDNALTLEEVGAHFGVTRERIRQIESKAISRLRHPERFGRFMADIGIEMAPGAYQSAEESGSTSTSDIGGSPAEEGRAACPNARHAAPKAFRHDSSPCVDSRELDGLLSGARDAGIAVEDCVEGSASRVLVRITATPDRRSRKLVRKLIEHGFEFCPGKGYWR